MLRRWIVVLSGVLALGSAHAAAAGSAAPVPVRRPAMATVASVPLTFSSPRSDATRLSEPVANSWSSASQLFERSPLRVHAGPGAMASKGAGRVDLSGTGELQNAALPALGRPLTPAGLPAANGAFSGGDGLGQRVRLHLATPGTPGWSARSAVALDGSADVRVGWTEADATGLDVAAAAAVGLDHSADRRVVVDASLASWDRTTGWNGAISASLRSSSTGTPHQVYAKFGRRWQMEEAVAAAVSLDGGLARHADTDAASVGVAGKLSLADVAHLFLAYRCYGARRDERAGVAQHVVAGGRWRF